MQIATPQTENSGKIHSPTAEALVEANRKTLEKIRAAPGCALPPRPRSQRARDAARTRKIFLVSCLGTSLPRTSRHHAGPAAARFHSPQLSPPPKDFPASGIHSLPPPKLVFDRFFVAAAHFCFFREIERSTRVDHEPYPLIIFCQLNNFTRVPCRNAVIQGSNAGPGNDRKNGRGLSD